MGNRLLLADDSITIQKVVAIIFANEEFELTVVDNGTAALEKAREIKPDVMLVDALMPGKTGYEVCAEIRRDPVLGAVPILLLIGAFEPLDEEKARDCGADATISKPFESQQLIDRVKEMLELGKTRKTVPPVAQPVPAEPAAEELWGDLSSFDAMAQAAPAAAAPPAEDIWESVTAQAEAEPAWEAPADLEEPAWEIPDAPIEPVASAQPAAAVQPAPAPPVAQEELVEANQEDDLWGAFELEEQTPAAAAEPPSELFGVVEPEAEFEAEEIFSFDESEEIEETGPALDLEEAQPVDSELTVSEEEFFAFSEEPEEAVAVPAEEAENEAEAFGVPQYQPFEFDVEPAPQAAAPAAPAAVQPEPAFAAATAAPAAAAAPAQAAVPQATAVPELTADQLVAALSKVSREVIERIVWEVVPDLAEVIIKEEIRKLKSGVRG